MDRMPPLICQNLELDVPRLLQVLFQIQAAVSKGSLGLRAGDTKRFFKIGQVLGYAHPAPAAARRCLDDHRIPDLSGDGGDINISGDQSGDPGTTGTPAAAISSRARALAPIASIAAAEGPINLMPEVSQISAK